MILCGIVRFLSCRILECNFSILFAGHQNWLQTKHRNVERPNVHEFSAMSLRTCTAISTSHETDKSIKEQCKAFTKANAMSICDSH